VVNVKLEKVCKYFGKVKAVDNIDLYIKDSEFFVLLGPSGCGKTTTLLLIAGFYKPDSGHIFFDEKIIDDLPPKDRNVGIVFQSYALYPHMTVFDNIAFPLKLKKIHKEEIRKKVKMIAEFLGIQELLDRRPFQLSGGQQQRVALARALVKEPCLFLLDEPLSNLDAKLRAMVRTELKKLQKQLRITTIYVTHDQIEAMTMADRVAVMNNGKIYQVDSPDKLYENPKNMFVAEFIGSPTMNFIDCSVSIDKHGEVTLESGAFKLKLPENMSIILREKMLTEVIFGIRPEDIFVQEKPYPNYMETEIYMIEPLGRERLITLRLEDIYIKVLVPTVKNIKEKAWIYFNMEKAHLFNKNTGEALL
jgi:ABC-type sugar transport system ATPase subunit